MVNTKPLHDKQVICKLETGVRRSFERSVCYCKFVGHNQLCLPARNIYDESTLHRFYKKKQFVGVKSVLGSDSVNLSPLHWNGQRTLQVSVLLVQPSDQEPRGIQRGNTILTQESNFHSDCPTAGCVTTFLFQWWNTWQGYTEKETTTLGKHFMMEQILAEAIYYFMNTA